MSQRINFSYQHPEVERLLDQYEVNLKSLLAYKQNIISSLFQGSVNGEIEPQFVGMSKTEVEDYFQGLLKELDVLFSMSLLSAVEAKIRLDFLNRVYSMQSDLLSQEFIKLYQDRGRKVRLDDIIKFWKVHDQNSIEVLGRYKGAIHYRDWIAHGRYWVHGKISRTYDFSTIYLICKEVVNKLSFI